MESEMVAQAIAQFPKEFGLRAYPDKRFRISESASYVSSYPAPDTIYLYTVILNDDGVWRCFCKGTPAELRRELVTL